MWRSTAGLEGTSYLRLHTDGVMDEEDKWMLANGSRGVIGKRQLFPCVLWVSVKFKSRYDTGDVMDLIFRILLCNTNLIIS